MDTTQKPKITPKDFFWQFGALIALYVSAGSLISRLFTVINQAFPDALDQSYYYSASAYSSGMRFAIASLIIVFPTYLILSWLISKESAALPGKKALGLRRWLTYVTLFASVALALIDLVTLVNYFLGGEISTRFILKVISVLVIAVGVFFYYLYDLRQSAGEIKRFKIFSIISAALVLVSMVIGFMVMGLPANQRAAQFDMTRINDLQSLQSQITYYYQQKGTVPADLSALADPISNYSIPKDPETGADYQYQKVSALSFKLCAMFGTDASTTDRVYAPKAITLDQYGATNQNWQHDKGNVCFTRTIDPELYPPIKK